MLDYKRLKKSFDIVINNSKYAAHCKPIVIVTEYSLDAQYQYRELYSSMSEDSDIRIMSNNVTHQSLTFKYRDEIMELKIQSKDHFASMRGQKYGYVFVDSKAENVKILALVSTMSSEYNEEYYIKPVVEMF